MKTYTRFSKTIQRVDLPIYFSEHDERYNDYRLVCIVDNHNPNYVILVYEKEETKGGIVKGM